MLNVKKWQTSANTAIRADILCIPSWNQLVLEGSICCKIWKPLIRKMTTASRGLLFSHASISGRFSRNLVEMVAFISVSCPAVKNANSSEVHFNWEIQLTWCVMPCVMRYDANMWCPSVLFYSVSWSSRAAFQQSPFQWNVRVCVPVYLVRSSEMQHTKRSALVSTAVLFTKKWKGLGLDDGTFYLYFSLFTSDTWNSPPIFLVCSFRPFHLSPVLIFISFHSLLTHTHTPLPVFWQLQGAVTEWVCVSLFVTKMGFGWMDGGILEEKCNHKKSDREKDGLLPLWASSQLGGGYRR